MENISSKIANFIHAHQRKNIQEALFRESNRELYNARMKLTDAIFSHDDTQLPIEGENIVVRFDGDTYLVTLDLEGEHCHEIMQVDEILDL